MVFHWCLRDCKSPRVSGTLLSILAVLNNVVVWMVSTRPPTSNSSSPFSNTLVTVPNAPITIGTIVTFIFHRFLFFFNSLARSRYFPRFAFFQVYSVVSRDSKVDNFANSIFFFFLLIIIKSGRLSEIGWSVCMSKSLWILCVLFSRTGDELYIYHLFVGSNFNFNYLHISLFW